MLWRLKGLSAHESSLLWGVAIAGLLFRLVAIAAFGHSPESDELAYRSMALNLLAGKGIVDHMGNLAMYNVCYPLFILAPAFLVDPNELLVARVFNALLGTGGIFVCHAIAREVGSGVIGRLVAAVLWAFYLPAAIYVVYLAKENLMTLLVLGSVYFSLRLLNGAGRSAAIGCGACFGGLALTGNAALSLLIVVPVVLYFSRKAEVDRIQLGMLVLIFAIAIPAPWVMRNMHALGVPLLNTNGGFNLYVGNNPAATGMFVSIGDTPRGESWQSIRQQGEVYASELLRKEAISWIEENPRQFAALAVQKLAYFWMPPFHRGAGEQSKVEILVRALWALQFVILILAAAGTLLIQPLRRRGGVGLLWLAIGSYTAVHMLFYVIFRYREPIMPLVSVLAALVIEHLVLGEARDADLVR